MSSRNSSTNSSSAKTKANSPVAKGGVNAANKNKDNPKPSVTFSENSSDDKNGHVNVSADYDEISTGSKSGAKKSLFRGDPNDTRSQEEKAEAFRRIASAEESEELDSFYNASDSFDATQEADLANMDPEQRQKLQDEWKNELMKTEEEIQTLRQVLSAKVRQAQELKRKMGITAWKEFREDMEQGIKNIQETTAYKEASIKITQWNLQLHDSPISGLGKFSAPAYQKTTEGLKTVGERTTSVFGSIGGSIGRKLGEVKNSNAFKSFEERVGSAVTNVKTKMGGSRSNSTTSFEDALNRSSPPLTPLGSPTGVPNTENKS